MRVLLVLLGLLTVLGAGAYVVVWILTPWEDGSIPLEEWTRPRR